MTKFDFDADLSADAAVFEEEADCIFIDNRDGSVICNKRTGDPIMITFAGPTHPLTRQISSDAFKRSRAQAEALRRRTNRSKEEDADLAKFEAELRDTMASRALSWSGISVPFSKEACVAFLTKFTALEPQALDFLTGDGVFLKPKKASSSTGAAQTLSSDAPAAPAADEPSATN